MPFNHHFKFCLRYSFLLILLAAIMPSCQDDPILTPVNDGIPEFTVKTKASITLVQLNTFPAVDPNGDTWDTIDLATLDTSGDADIFFNFTIPEPQPPILWSQPSHFDNVKPTDTVPYILLEPYQVIPFGSTIDVNVYDFELPDSTLMGTFSFLIGKYPDPLHPYPDYVTTTQNGYSVTIGIKWEE